MKKINYFLLTKSIGFGLNVLSYLQRERASQIAYQLFSKPRKGKLVKENLPYFLQNIPLQRLSVEAEHVETYIWKGNKNVILLVHGWESNTSRWEKLLPYLQQAGSTIVALDAPGHGLSGGTEFNVVKYATYIQTVVREFKPSVLIGHSIGGAACIYFQSQYRNEHIQKMVILGAPADYDIIVENYVNLLRLNNRMKNLLHTKFSEKLNAEINQFSMATFAKEIEIPGLIIHDVDDEIVKFAEGQKISNAWQNTELIQTKGLGHSLHDQNVYEKIVDFLKS